MSSTGVQLVLRVEPRFKELLRGMADENKRSMTAEFEVIMEEEAARRLARFSPSGNAKKRTPRRPA